MWTTDGEVAAAQRGASEGNPTITYPFVDIDTLWIVIRGRSSRSSKGRVPRRSCALGTVDRLRRNDGASLASERRRQQVNSSRASEAPETAEGSPTSGGGATISGGGMIVVSKPRIYSRYENTVNYIAVVVTIMLVLYILQLIGVFSP
jgi:hypothetical protein